MGEPSLPPKSDHPRWHVFLLSNHTRGGGTLDKVPSASCELSETPIKLPRPLLFMLGVPSCSCAGHMVGSMCEEHYLSIVNLSGNRRTTTACNYTTFSPQGLDSGAKGHKQGVTKLRGLCTAASNPVHCDSEALYGSLRSSRGWGHVSQPRTGVAYVACAAPFPKARA